MKFKKCTENARRDHQRNLKQNPSRNLKPVFGACRANFRLTVMAKLGKETQSKHI